MTFQSKKTAITNLHVSSLKKMVEEEGPHYSQRECFLRRAEKRSIEKRLMKSISSLSKISNDLYLRNSRQLSERSKSNSAVSQTKSSSGNVLEKSNSRRELLETINQKLRARKVVDCAR